jgi:HTH-type transcriptional regulator/antitoxin HigA
VDIGFKGSEPFLSLKYLMREHDIRQSDLPEIGSQGVVSEVLTGKRELNVRQVNRLAKRFGVSVETFI